MVSVFNCAISFKQCPDELIKSAPFENVTVPLGQTTLVNFSCDANATFVIWAINGTSALFLDTKSLQNRGITLYPPVPSSPGMIISMDINVTTATNNNTEIYCIASDRTNTDKSATFTLTVAGKIMIGT